MRVMSWLKTMFSKPKEVKLSCRPECKYCTDMEDKYYPSAREMVCQPRCIYCNP